MGNNAVTSSATAPSIATAAVGPTLAGAANGFVTQTLTLAGNGTVNTTPSLAGGSSAKTIATAINAFTALSGITAVATTKATISNVSLGSVQFQLQGSNVPPETPITVSATINNTSDLAVATVVARWENEIDVEVYKFLSIDNRNAQFFCLRRVEEHSFHQLLPRAPHTGRTNRSSNE